MTAAQLTQQFREVFLDGTWIATNWKTELADVSWQEAITPVGPLNTIAALTFHIDYYVAGVLQVLRGGSLDIRDRYSFAMPPLTTAQQWESLRDQLEKDAEAFAEQLAQLPPEQWSAAFVNEKYGTYFRNMTGMIEHSYYHLGQVVIIKKLLRQ